MSAFFVTSTGTEIGKTYVVEQLASDWLKEGRSVRALKPVISDFDSDHPEGSDTARLLKATGKALNGTEIDIMSPWRYKAALSPDMAAARENQRVPFEDVAAYCERAISQAKAESTSLLIEGIGGVMVPIDETRTILDLILAIRIPVILVAGSYLGTLSHTLTSVLVLRDRNVQIDRIYVNETRDSTVPLDETIDTLRRFVREIPIETMRFDPNYAHNP